MAKEVTQGYAGERFFSDLNTRLRDLEERYSLIRDRILMVSDSFVKDRKKKFEESQELRKAFMELKEENERMREMLTKISTLLSESARKEELMILQRQFNLFRNDK